MRAKKGAEKLKIFNWATIFDWITRVGAIFGLFALPVSLVQFTFTQVHEAKINAAVDISKRYLQDWQLKSAETLFGSRGDQHKVVPDDEDGMREREFVDVNDYIALLVNQDRINAQYLSPRIKCDIKWIASRAQNERPDVASYARQAIIYAKSISFNECK